MTTSTPVTAEYQIDGQTETSGRRGSHRRRWLLLAVVIVAAIVAVGVIDPFSATHPTSSGVTNNADPTSLATVLRQDLSNQTEVSATLGYAGSYMVVGGSSGTFTELPSVGEVVSQGQVLYRVDNSPVVLLYGATPAYRSLSEGASASDVTGPDVERAQRRPGGPGVCVQQRSEPDIGRVRLLDKGRSRETSGRPRGDTDRHPGARSGGLFAERDPGDLPDGHPRRPGPSRAALSWPPPQPPVR